MRKTYSSFPYLKFGFYQFYSFIFSRHVQQGHPAEHKYHGKQGALWRQYKWYKNGFVGYR